MKQQNNETKLFLLFLEDTRCITENLGFDAVCLNKDVLWTALVSLNDREGSWLPPENEVSNKSYRYAAYRQFSWFIYTKLGKNVRRIIPSCAVSRIREAFPAPDGKYVNFDGDDEGIPDVDDAWKYGF